MWFINVDEEQETSAPPPKKNPGSVPDIFLFFISTQSFCNLWSTDYSWGLRNVELGKHNCPTWECKKIRLLQKKVILDMFARTTGLAFHGFT